VVRVASTNTLCTADDLQRTPILPGRWRMVLPPISNVDKRMGLLGGAGCGRPDGPCPVLVLGQVASVELEAGSAPCGGRTVSGAGPWRGESAPLVENFKLESSRCRCSQT
jgi:hypothetical protein